MTDPRSSPGAPSAPAPEKASVAAAVAGDVSEQVSALASQASDRVADIGSQASSSAAGLKESASGLVDSVKGIAAESVSKVSSALEDQKAAGADIVSGFAAALRRAGDEIGKELPPAATFIHQAADQIASASDAVRRRDLRQLADSVQDFARRQPAAFLGVTVLAGFALTRLLKTPIPATTQGAQTAPALEGTNQGHRL